MWVCLYICHIIVIIMIIISIIGVVYGIAKKKIKAMQIVTIALFCLISMALVAGVTAMKSVSDTSNLTISATKKVEINNYWICDDEKMQKISSVGEYTKYLDNTTGNMFEIKNNATKDKLTNINLENKEEADEACQSIDIKKEFNATNDYLITLNSKEFIKASDNVYYVTYNYTYTKEDKTKETGKLYYITNKNGQVKTFVKTIITNATKEQDFENSVLEIIKNMNF